MATSTHLPRTALLVVLVAALLPAAPSTVASLQVTLAVPLAAQEPTRSLTLEDALTLADEGSDALAASRARVREAARAGSIAFSSYLPRVETQANYVATNNSQGILLPMGSLGNLPALGGAFPPEDLNIRQGGTDLFFTFTTVAQPLTQYFRIRHGVGAARADRATAEAGLNRAEQEVALGVIQAYAGLLIAQQALEVARTRATAAEERMRYAGASQEAGSALEVNEREARVAWLQARQTVLEREDEIEDLNYQLVDLLGLEPGTRLRLEDPGVPAVESGMALEEWVDAALRRNPDVREARALDTKADHGLGAAKAAYIPEVGLIGAHLYQSSLPFFPENTFGVGIQAKWTIFDFGARSSAVDESQARVEQAERNLSRVRGQVRGEVAAAYRKLERAREQLALAEEAQQLRSEGARLQELESRAGFAVPAQRHEAAADELEGELDLLRARMGVRIAVAELRLAAGLLDD